MTQTALLLISNGTTCHKQQLHQEDVITIGSKPTDSITYPELTEALEVSWKENQWQVGEQPLPVGRDVKIAPGLTFHLLEELETKHYDISAELGVTIGSDKASDIVLSDVDADFVLLRDQKTTDFTLTLYEGEVYHNFERVTQKKVLQAGDQLYVGGIHFQIEKEAITIIAASGQTTSRLAPLFAADNALPEDYPDYHRSPRIIYRAPENKLTIAKPASKPTKPTEGLLKVILPPLVMIAITLLVSIFQPRGIYILMTLGMTSMTVIMSLTTFIKNSKQYKVDTKEREEKYQAYLKTKTKELHEISEKQNYALNYHYPSIEEIQTKAVQIDPRIYEKTMFHHDFLTFRVGLGTEDSSFKIDFKEEQFSQEKDALIDDARRLKEQYHFVPNVPVATDLMNGPVGYIGPRRLVIEQLQMLVMQTAFFHSYYDVQFITIFPEEEKQDWEWMRWLPHADLRDVNVRGFVYHERSRDQVLNSLYQILKERKQALTENPNKNEKMYFTPHFVVLITDEKMILDHTVMEFFNEDPSELGVSLVFVQDVMQSLPEHVKTVVDIRDSKNGNIILEQGELVNRAFHPDHLPKDFDKEVLSRALAPLNHLQNLKNSIPETVTFLEMYGVDHVEDLNIAMRWQTNETYKSLAVPLGLRGKDDLVQLNLHEKAHGPHGLVAGTTGSGKSEIIQSYIISLGVNFHPYEVAFLLIDYKGGGMANLFRNMPHLLGTITNLDGAQSMRALASIKAELQKRQRLFGEYDVNHINQYQKLYKQGKAKEAMPHLFLISDEFAELKSEQPEFMKELVSTARIGRSLGIHLILATQKPSGVVDDQIWSNSKFKLALKVQNASDSSEILKTPDAADITLPGRAYLQVGNNEIYELFQSAWSGADYIPDKEDESYMDTTVYAINDLGQYDILTEDLSGLDKKDELTKLPSELDAVIDHIHAYTEAEGIEALARPWLPPLEERIYLPELERVVYEESWKENKSMRITVGILDEPQLQAQSNLELDFNEDGHVAIFSSSGYGKSTFMQSILFALARKNSPCQLHAYLLDFGTNGLLSLKNLPHVADTMSLDDVEKCMKFMRRISEEIKTRKKLLSHYSVANLKMYEEISGEQKEAILIMIDNYDAIKEVNEFTTELEPLIIQIAREGANLGIHLVMSAGGQNAIRLQLLSSIKRQIAFYLIEKGDISGIVGRTELTLEEIPGRGLIKMDEPTLFQAALPNDGEDGISIINKNQKEAQEMCDYWEGDLPAKIPMVPDELVLEEFFAYPKTKTYLAAKNILPLGLEFEYADTVGTSIGQHNLAVVMGTIDSVTKMMMILGKITIHKSYEEVVVLDTPSLELVQLKEFQITYISNIENMQAKIGLLHENLQNRESAYLKALQNEDATLTKEKFFEEYPRIIVLLGSTIALFKQLNLESQNQLIKLLKSEGKNGISFIAGNDLATLSKDYEDAGEYLKSAKAVMLGVRFGDQIIYTPSVRIIQEQSLAQNEVYLFEEGHAEKIRIPK